ncbi:hypothetical protein AB6A40_003676 [Gnathostoma spinigerum]|uniref:Lethal giant larvae homologue 2 domain-containing protein n=1 Tax=Gnathostoma spinigerum TaxID=75299 RepID=A0ABD6EJV1_9BILA
MDRAKKKLASAIDGLRNLHTKCELELEEKVSSEHICLAKIVRHGFPDDPRCIAYDPVQRLIAIGSGHGSVRILGDAGVDCFLKHESDAAVLHLQFIINEGMLIAACRDDLIHLWSFKTKIPELVQSIQINKEQVTCINLPFRSKWLYVGTERGNVYFVNVVTFSMSCYAINWNKAIDLSCRTHPGSVKSIRQCPTDVSKLLIVYEKGVVIVWNVLTKEVDRFQSEYMVRCATWHQDGKQLLFGNADGSLTVWNLKKSGGEMIQRTTPHGAKCRPITQVDWRHTSDGEQLIVFNGGMPQEDGVLPSLTIIKGSRSATVLEMDYPVVAFLPLTSSPYPNVPLHPFAVAVLLKSDLLVVDMNSSGYPCFENANPMDIHESRVTLLEYFSDCPIDLLGALTLVGCKQRRQNFSDKAWPISGGVGRQCATGHQELLLTGHEDGSLKFWQASGETLQILYKLKTGRHFEKSGNIENKDISHAVAGVEMCLDARLLLVASQSGQVTLFRFYKAENAHEIATVNIPNENKGYTNSCADDQVSSSSGSTKELKRQGKALSQESQSSDTSEGSSYEGFIPLKVRGGALRRPAGYQPELVCLIPWRDDSKPEIITAMKINSAYGILAIGTESGLVLVDTMQYTLIYSWSTLELYGRGSIPSCLLRQNSETPSDSIRPSKLLLPDNLIPPEALKQSPSPVSPRSFFGSRPWLLSSDAEDVVSDNQSSICSEVAVSHYSPAFLDRQISLEKAGLPCTATCSVRRVQSEYSKCNSAASSANAFRRTWEYLSFRVPKGQPLDSSAPVPNSNVDSTFVPPVTHSLFENSVLSKANESSVKSQGVLDCIRNASKSIGHSIADKQPGKLMFLRCIVLLSFQICLSS